MTDFQRADSFFIIVSVKPDACCKVYGALGTVTDFWKQQSQLLIGNYCKDLVTYKRKRNIASTLCVSYRYK